METTKPASGRCKPWSFKGESSTGSDIGLANLLGRLDILSTRSVKVRLERIHHADNTCALGLGSLFVHSHLLDLLIDLNLELCKLLLLRVLVLGATALRGS
jgi:hypothetical protein